MQKLLTRSIVRVMQLVHTIYMEGEKQLGGA